VVSYFLHSIFSEVSLITLQFKQGDLLSRENLVKLALEKPERSRESGEQVENLEKNSLFLQILQRSKKIQTFVSLFLSTKKYFQFFARLN
jgi:hypothetical protein